MLMRRRRNTFFNCRNLINKSSSFKLYHCSTVSQQVIFTRRNLSTSSRADRKESIFHDCFRGGDDLALCVTEVHLSGFYVLPLIKRWLALLFPKTIFDTIFNQASLLSCLLLLMVQEFCQLACLGRTHLLVDHHHLHLCHCHPGKRRSRILWSWEQSFWLSAQSSSRNTLIL